MQGNIYKVEDVVTGNLKFPVTISQAIQVNASGTTLDTTLTSINNNLSNLNDKLGIDFTLDYVGGPINLKTHKFKSTSVLTLSQVTTNCQAMAKTGNYIFIVGVPTTSGGGSTPIRVYNATNGNFISSFNINTYYHGNSMKFSKIIPSGTDIPYLYIDQWDSDRKYAVVKITRSGTTFSASIWKTITVSSSISASIFGGGMTDWVADEDNNLLYSFTYKKSGSTTYQDTDNNGLYICKFVLPDITSSTTVTLTDSDIIQSWKRSCIYVRQQCDCKNGLFFITAGYKYTGTPTISDPAMYVLDCNMNLYAQVDLKQITYNEPEGFVIEDDGSILYLAGSGGDKIYKFDFGIV